MLPQELNRKDILHFAAYHYFSLAQALSFDSMLVCHTLNTNGGMKRLVRSLGRPSLAILGPSVIHHHKRGPMMQDNLCTCTIARRRADNSSGGSHTKAMWLYNRRITERKEFRQNALQKKKKKRMFLVSLAFTSAFAISCICGVVTTSRKPSRKCNGDAGGNSLLFFFFFTDECLCKKIWADYTKSDIFFIFVLALPNQWFSHGMISSTSHLIVSECLSYSTIGLVYCQLSEYCSTSPTPYGPFPTQVFNLFWLWSNEKKKKNVRSLEANSINFK